MKVSVNLAMSIDGFIAKDNGDVEWLNNIPNPDKSDYGFKEFMAKNDVIVMGRNTFEKVQTFGFWPYEKQVYVLSDKLKKLPYEILNKVKIINGSPVEVLEIIRNDGYKNIYLDGGVTICKFLNENLIDEMTLTKIPIILGSGIKLFSQKTIELSFKIADYHIFNNSLVQITYSKY